MQATAPGSSRVKMTVRVYTVTREEIVTPPQAALRVPFGHQATGAAR